MTDRKRNNFLTASQRICNKSAAIPGDRDGFTGRTEGGPKEIQAGTQPLIRLNSRPIGMLRTGYPSIYGLGPRGGPRFLRNSASLAFCSAVSTL